MLVALCFWIFKWFVRQHYLAIADLTIRRTLRPLVALSVCKGPNYGP